MTKANNKNATEKNLMCPKLSKTTPEQLEGGNFAFNSEYTVDYMVYIFLTLNIHCTKMKFSIKDFFSKYDHIHSFLRIWLYLLNKFLMENFVFVQRYVFPVMRQFHYHSISSN